MKKSELKEIIREIIREEMIGEAKLKFPSGGSKTHWYVAVCVDAQKGDNKHKYIAMNVGDDKSISYAINNYTDYIEDSGLTLLGSKTKSFNGGKSYPTFKDLASAVGRKNIVHAFDWKGKNTRPGPYIPKEFNQIDF